jgi:orotate phosphoribosyltransferase
MQQSNIEQYKTIYNFIKENCIVDGEFILSSGKKTTRYFDLRYLTLNGRWGHLIAHAIRTELDKHGVSIHEFESIGGMESAAIPIVSTLANSWGKLGFYTRKIKKDHGLLKSVEGNIGESYLLVDDTVSTGMSMVKVQEIVGFKPVAMICLVDRMLDRHYGLISLFRETDFLLEDERESIR